MSNKEFVRAALDRMPETATFAEIREELAILSAIRTGKADIDAGRTVSHEEVKQRSAEWNSR